MRESTKERVRGKYHELKGKIKETTGEALSNPKVEMEGREEKIAGKVQERLGKIKKGVEK